MELFPCSVAMGNLNLLLRSIIVSQKANWCILKIKKWKHGVITYDIEIHLSPCYAGTIGLLALPKGSAGLEESLRIISPVYILEVGNGTTDSNSGRGKL